jgi:NADH:ubiquinone oxidoreductase subunit 2 (subunit N)
LVLLAIINSVIGAYIYLRIIIGLLNLKLENNQEAIQLPKSKQIVLVVCSVGLLIGWLSIHCIS